jgi:hypothetical protein
MVLNSIHVVRLSNCLLAQLSRTFSASFTATPLTQYRRRFSPPHQSSQLQTTGTMFLLPLSHPLFTLLHTTLFHTQNGARKPSRPHARLAWETSENPSHLSFGPKIAAKNRHCTTSAIRDLLSRKDSVINLLLVLLHNAWTQNQAKSMEKARWSGRVG